MLRAFLLLSLGLVGAQASFAGEHFRALRDDLTVDDRCEEYKQAYFLQERVSYFTVGIEGSTRRGFDEEVPITRSQARTLWHALRASSSPNARRSALDKIKSSSALLEMYELLIEAVEMREASYSSEGEVLEVLSYEYLRQSSTYDQLVSLHQELYPEIKSFKYFITGGVVYHSSSGRTVGELDILIGDASTCTIFGIGEAKLSKGTSKAWKQLRRIQGFLRDLAN